jgi:hypothetical protein
VIFVVEYLREYESIFENTLAHESVDPGVQFHEKKTRGQKSRETVPLIIQLNIQVMETIPLNIPKPPPPAGSHQESHLKIRRQIAGCLAIR